MNATRPLWSRALVASLVALAALVGALAPLDAHADVDGVASRVATTVDGDEAKRKALIAQIELDRVKLAVRTQLQLRAGMPVPPGEGDADNHLLRGDLVERPGFAVPRARFGISGELDKHIKFAMVTDMTDGELVAGWIGYDKWNFARIYAGSQTVPFARSAMYSSVDAALAERARSASTMAPFRQVGLTLAGSYDLGLSWFLGAYNGWNRGNLFWQGAVPNAGLDGNRFNGLSYVGRVEYATGDVGGPVADQARGPFRIGFGGGGYYNDGGTIAGWGASADLILKVRGLHVLVEYIVDDASPDKEPTEPTVIPASLRRSALIAEAGYYLPSDVSIAVRGELIDTNADVDDNEDEMWLSASVGYHLLGNQARVMLNYDHRQEMDGEALANDSLYLQFQARM
jgi:hypothetical protein